MTTMTITITEDRMAKLTEMARRFNLSPEQLVDVSIEDFLARSEQDFQQAAEHVLKKNAALYERLS